MLTHTQALEKTLTALHEIASAINVRRLLEKPSMSPIIRLALEKKAKTDDEIQQLAVDVWAQILLEVEPRLADTTIFECTPELPTDGQVKP